MFYQGDLQSGISHAVSQSKLVGCFVHNDSETSKEWEEEFLTSDDLPQLFEEKAVLLQLREGSREAGFLSQMYPIYQVPTLMILGDGLLKLYISSNPPVSKEDFTRRVKAAFQESQVSDAVISLPNVAPSVPNETSATPIPPAQSSYQAPATSSEAQPPSQQPSASTSQAQLNRQLFTERAQKLAADKRAKDAAAEEAAALEEEAALQEAALEETAQTKADREAYEAGKPIDPMKRDSIKYAKLRSERMKKERDNLALVRKRVEDDKIERRIQRTEQKERELAWKEEALAAAKLEPKGDDKKATGAMQTCAIQIRLFDGSTIRNLFSTSDTLSISVRKWISAHYKNQAEKEVPYMFKQVLTPLPNRNIETAEESMSLKELGLVPNTTLVLVPAKNAVDAYASRGIVAWFTRLLKAIFGLFTMMIGMVTGLFSAAVPSSTDQNSGMRARDGAARTDVIDREERQRKRDEKREFYNGNNLSFEPRRDEDEGEGA